jgi:hypothetical protein
VNPATANALRVLLGCAIALAWIAGASLVISLSLMGTLMANDAGTVSAEAQTQMVLLVLGGQLLAGAAGIPLGLAVFWRARRKLLLRLCAGLLGAGLLAALLGVYIFASQPAA